jgi:hypothetical protein
MRRAVRFDLCEGVKNFRTPSEEICEQLIQEIRD